MMKSIRAECIYTITIPKPGEGPENCQDACSVNLENQRFAISDGVTKSFLSADWARLLVESFSNDKKEMIDFLFSSKDWEAWLIPIQKKWEQQARNMVGRLLEAKYVYMRNQLAQREPAAATFIGLQKKVGDKNNWQFILIGDSCLFHLSNKLKTVITYPMNSSAEFNSHPGAFLSYPTKPNGVPSFNEISVEIGDYVIMCTDALSKLLFQLKEKKDKSFNQTLIRLLEKEGVEKFVEGLRLKDDFPLESDDVGIVVLFFKEFSDQGGVEKIVQETIQSQIENLQPVQIQDFKSASIPSSKNLPEQESKLSKNTPQYEPNQKKANLGCFSRVVLIGLLIIAVFSFGYLYGYYKNLSSPSIKVSRGSVIVMSPVDSYTVLEVTKDIDMVLLGTQILDGVTWNRVEYSVWFRCFPLPNRRDLYQLDSPQYVYLNPKNPDVVGIIPVDVSILVVKQMVMDEEIWCHAISNGYVFDNEK